MFGNLLKYIWRRKGLLAVVTVLAAGCGYYLWLHRMPFTQNAFVVANIRPVSALVEGYITDIYVTNNRTVRKGDPLFRIFTTPYELKVKALAASLTAEEFNQKSIEFKIKAAEAEVQVKTSVYDNAKYLADQAIKMYGEQATSQKYMEENVSAMQEAMAALIAAKNTLASVKQQCLQSQSTQLQLKNQLELARVNLSLTTVTALADGTVTSMFMSPGTYVTPGKVLFAFIETKTWWIQANFKETELAHLRPDQEARIWLWQYPGKEFRGRVEPSGWGVDRKTTSAVSGMPVVEKENEWFLLPQRFPVQIRITDPDPAYPLHPGASAFVQIKTPARPLRQFFWQLFQ